MNSVKIFVNSVYAVLLARLREFYRDKHSFLWHIIFPIFIILCFYFVFSGERKDLYKVGVADWEEGQPLPAQDFYQLKYVQFIPVETQDGIHKVRHYKLDLLVQLGDPIQYWTHFENPNGYFLEKLLTSSDQKSFMKKSIQGKPIRYVDWVFPAIIALNILFSCLWGGGWIIVKYRDEGYLKRLSASPLKVSGFILGQVLSRLVIVACITSFIYTAGSYLIDFEMRGSYLNLMICYFFGVLSLVPIGILAASRTTNKELADGILNLFSWPMFIFSGLWFSMEGVSPWLKYFSYSLPLTHLVESTRSIMLEEASLFDVSFNIVSMMVISAVLFILASILFKWNEK